MHLRGVNKPWGTRGARAGKALGTRGARAPQKGARAQNGVILDLRFAEPPHLCGAFAFPLYNIKREKWGAGKGWVACFRSASASEPSGPYF